MDDTLITLSPALPPASNIPQECEGTLLLSKSKALGRSIKVTNKGCFCSQLFSCTCLRVMTMSIADLLALKPHKDSQ